MATRKLGPYIVGETLGEGGFSKVKLGVHEETGEKVALKILRKNKLTLNASTEKQVRREIEAMARIQHPNVIRLKEVDWDAVYTKKNGKKMDIILVILELATGGELFEFLSFTGCFEEAIARTYFHQLISGVAYAHDRGVAHRDLKPENLLLDGDFVLKLADFGFAGCFKPALGALMYTECGTPAYMAPEMFNNKGYDARPCDIWACGVILFIMIAGFPPFQKPNNTDWWFQKLESQRHHLFWAAHSRNQYFSDSTKDFLNKILCTDPAKRITVGDILKHEWFQGPTISHAQLQQELGVRKAQVDEAKVRARQAERAAQGKANAASRAESGLDADVVRDIGDDLPDGPPAMSFNNLFAKNAFEGGAGGGMMDGGFGGMMDSGFGGMMANMGFEEKEPTKAQLYEDNGTACYTRFESESDADAIVNRLTGVLEAMQGQYASKDDFKVKAVMNGANGSVTISAQVFQRPDNDRRVVEFRRRKGDGMSYRSLYQTIRTQLADLVFEEPKEVVEEDL